jgi:hypothetical protein
MGRNSYLRKRSILDRAASTVRNFFCALGLATLLYHAYCGHILDAIMIYLVNFPIELIKIVINGT